MRKKVKKEERPGQKFRRAQTQILLSYVIVIFVASFILAMVLLGQSDVTIKDTASGLIAANSRQLELNINSYLDKVETTATLLFADEAYYQFDMTDPSLSEYEKIQQEALILDRIVDVGLMENFVDFCIVYADDDAVGWLSNGTADMFSKGGMYGEFASHITNARTNDGWISGLQGNFDRMYYVKRLNPNAVLVASFYSRELKTVFEYPEELEGMTVRFINGEQVILFSSQTEEIGETLPDSIYSLIGDKGKDTVVGKDDLATVNTCDNGWRVVCSIPMDVVLEGNIELRSFSLLLTAAFSLLFAVIGFLIIRHLIEPVGGMVSGLQERAEQDPLTGLLNKISFEEEVRGRLKEKPGSALAVLCMLDMDNFKEVNDTLGHAQGDQVLVRAARLLTELFGEQYVLGRLGGDEFGLYVELFIAGEELAKRKVQSDMELLQSAFQEEFAPEKGRCGVTLSVGAVITAGNTSTFEELYEKADGELYDSKDHGKNRLTVRWEGGRT